MSVAIELRYGVERCGGTFPSDGDVGALVERARGAFEGLRGVAAGRLTLLASGGARIRGDDRGFDLRGRVLAKHERTGKVLKIMVVASGAEGAGAGGTSRGAEALRATRLKKEADAKAKAKADADADADAARSRDGASDETNERFAAWAATGIVGMRGCARREVASRAFDLGGKVRVLDYGANRLETVSPRISELSNVARIVLRDNALRSMPWSAIASLTRLTHLDLSGNAALGNDVATATPTCASLETLSLARCDIAGEVCDDFFRGLPRLKHVSLVANRLERLPAFETNGLLEVVDASRNAVVSIPASYGALACLRSLNLVGNRIELEGIPVELLKHAKALVELNLRENPILVEALRERDGWSEFEARRKRRADKALDSRVMLGDNVFDEGADNDRFVRH